MSFVFVHMFDVTPRLAKVAQVLLLHIPWWSTVSGSPEQSNPPCVTPLRPLKGINPSLAHGVCMAVNIQHTVLGSLFDLYDVVLRYMTTLVSPNIGCQLPLETCMAPKTITSFGAIPPVPTFHLGSAVGRPSQS